MSGTVRSYRIAEIEAGLDEVARRISVHRNQHPGIYASREEVARWKAEGESLVAEREALMYDRVHLIAGGSPC